MLAQGKGMSGWQGRPCGKVGRTGCRCVWAGEIVGRAGGRASGWKWVGRAAWGGGWVGGCLYLGWVEVGCGGDKRCSLSTGVKVEWQGVERVGGRALFCLRVGEVD